jgi:hypothetical protein
LKKLPGATEGKKAPELTSGRLGLRNLAEISYFFFLGAFFSFFLAFFFMRISSSVWVEDQRQRQPLALNPYTSGSRKSQDNLQGK